MVYYMYHGDYPIVQGDSKPYLQDHVLTPPGTVRSQDNLLLHVEVYLLAKEHKIKGLCQLAYEKFTTETAATDVTDIHFLEAAALVYQSLPFSNCALKDFVVDTLTRQPQRLNDPRAQEMLRNDTNLWLDVTMRFALEAGQR